MRYPKINSLYKRDETTRKFIDGNFADTVFDNIKYWCVEEKIDGMNIRIIITPETLGLKVLPDIVRGYEVEIKGRNEDSMLPESILKFYKEFMTLEATRNIMEFMKAKGKVILFGEGYGPKIQSGGNYRDDVGFILFDVWGGHRWSTREEVKALAAMLGLPTPHEFGIMKLEEIIELVKAKIDSPTAIRPMQFEGVIARSEPLLRNNYSGDPILFKLKCKDI